MLREELLLLLLETLLELVLDFLLLVFELALQIKETLVDVLHLLEFESLIDIILSFVDSANKVSLKRIDPDVIDDHGDPLVVTHRHAADVVLDEVDYFVEFL